MSAAAAAAAVAVDVPASCISPTGTRILIRVADPETVTPGGIHLAQTSQSKPQKGTVVCVGPGRRLDDGSYVPGVIKVGDSIIFEPYTGIEIEIGGEDLKLLNEENVLAIVREPQE
jgi:chaperonin GroES